MSHFLQDVAAGWLQNHPVESKRVLDLLTTVVIDYTSAQINAGADMMQVHVRFGTMCLRGVRVGMRKHVELAQE